MKNAFDIVRDFETALCDYTGSPYCVCVNSCTNALFLALKYQYDYGSYGIVQGKLRHALTGKLHPPVEIPKFTYVSVPMQILHAGFDVKFRDEDWSGIYQLKPFNIWDAARRFTDDMFTDQRELSAHSPLYICVSFHWSKILGIQQGGAILTNDQKFDHWARKARFDGRSEMLKPKAVDQYNVLGYHMYMSPEIAAEGLVRLMHLPNNNPDLPNDDYPDLSQIELFK